MSVNKTSITVGTRVKDFDNRNKTVINARIVISGGLKGPVVRRALVERIVAGLSDLEGEHDNGAVAERVDEAEPEVTIEEGEGHD